VRVSFIHRFATNEMATQPVTYQWQYDPCPAPFSRRARYPAVPPNTATVRAYSPSPRPGFMRTAKYAFIAGKMRVYRPFGGSKPAV
jgi:hypothetical protein